MQPLARRADAGQVVEHRARHRLVAPAAVELDREAVGLVADALEQLQLGRVVVEHAAARAGPGTKTSSIRLARLTHRHAQVAERARAP